MNKNWKEKEKEMKMKWTNEQITELEKKEQTRSVNHWRLILHWLNSIWIVMNKNKKWKREGTENETNKWTGNKIGDSGASKISEALKVNTTLTELNLSCDE